MFLRGLPLKEDQEESMAVYSCIYSLVLASNPEVFFSMQNFHLWLNILLEHLVNSLTWMQNQILAYVPDLVKIFGQVLESPVEKDEVKAIVGRTFSHLISVYGNQLQPLISCLPPSQANVLASFVSTS